MSRRLRLLHVGPLPPPFSGIGVSLEHLLASAPLQAHETFVLDSSASSLPGDPRQAKRPTPRRMLRHARLAAQTRRLVQQRGIDVVHLHGSSHDLSLFGNALSVLAARAAGCHTVWQLHEDLGVVAFPGRHAPTQSAFAALMRLPDAIAVLSDKDRHIAARFVDDRRLAVLPPTCNPALAAVSVERSREARSMTVLFVGWLTRDKGIYDLLQVAELLRDADPPVNFEVLGCGMSAEETAAAHAAVRERALAGQVRLRGVITGGAKLKAFADADAFFLPTHWDAFPVVVLEALAAGLPVLSTNVGGIPFLVDAQRGGRLTQPGNVAEFASFLVQLAGDPGRRLAMGQFNRERFLSVCHPDVVGQSAVDLYLRLTSTPGTSRYS